MIVKPKHIHIMGASGSGTTTLAAALADELFYDHFDSDDYFWKQKYNEMHPPAERLRLLAEALSDSRNWVLSGAILDWGLPIVENFDLVVFLSVPNHIRMDRLEKREKERFGDLILPGGARYDIFHEFMEWAAKYESGGTEVRSRYQHESWLNNLNCPVLRLHNALSVSENVSSVMNYI